MAEAEAERDLRGVQNLPTKQIERGDRRRPGQVDQCDCRP